MLLISDSHLNARIWMEIMPSIVFSGGYQKAVTCSLVANLMLPRIGVESTMRFYQGI